MYKYEILKVIENLVFDEFGEIHPSWLVPTWKKKNRATIFDPRRSIERERIRIQFEFYKLD